MDEIRNCAYCGGSFSPRSENQRFCKPGHKTKYRRHGGRNTELEASCPWCRKKFRSGDPLQAYCCKEHREQHRRCRAKNSFYSAEAAEAMARVRSSPALGRELGSYECAGPGERHWHLYNLGKRRARSLARRYARAAG
jgi:hypothetical protein